MKNTSYKTDCLKSDSISKHSSQNKKETFPGISIIEGAALQTKGIGQARIE